MVVRGLMVFLDTVVEGGSAAAAFEIRYETVLESGETNLLTTVGEGGSKNGPEWS